jgi:hypothetical protein
MGRVPDSVPAGATCDGGPGCDQRWLGTFQAPGSGARPGLGGGWGDEGGCRDGGGPPAKGEAVMNSVPASDRGASHTCGAPGCAPGCAIDGGGALGAGGPSAGWGTAGGIAMRPDWCIEAGCAGGGAGMAMSPDCRIDSGPADAGGPELETGCGADIGCGADAGCPLPGAPLEGGCAEAGAGDMGPEEMGALASLPGARAEAGPW